MSRIYSKIPSVAPDYSGAASVLHDMGGLIVFCDVGGCYGNYAAFDEPRMGFAKKLFTLGIREADLVMGVDRVAKKKIVESFRKLGGKFVALIGTPSTTLTGMDFRGLCAELQEELGVPAFFADTSGLFSYERGQEKIYQALAAYAQNIAVEEPVDVHVIGATPLDTWDYGQQDQFRKLLKDCGAKRPLIWGDSNTMDVLGSLEASKLNIAVSVSGIRVVQNLNKKYGTPYRIGFPTGNQQLAEWEKEITELLSGEFRENAEFGRSVSDKFADKRVLIVGEQVVSNALRAMLQTEFSCKEAHVASFFTMDKDQMKDGDFFAVTESFYVDELQKRPAYDIVIGDDFLTQAVPYQAELIRIPSIAISGL